MTSKLQEAIQALREGKFQSVRRAAIFFDVPETTWRNRYKGRAQSRVESHENQQHFDTEGEKALCRYICKVDDQGFRIKVKMLKSIAESLLITR